MSIRPLLFLLLLGLLAVPARAFPPAPHHTVYGAVRDQYGRPLNTGEGVIILNGVSTEIVRAPSDSSVGVGINYSLNVPMDSGTSAQLYEVTAMRPLLPFTIQVLINGVSFVPLEIVAKTWGIGKPSEKTRLDLTLGIDSNHDGLPDAWQEEVVNADTTGKLKGIDDVKPDADLSGNGLTNLQKFLAGVNALDRLDGVRIDVMDVTGGMVRLRFLGITGRTYTIRSSLDSTTWADQAFSTDPTGANPALTYRAETVKPVDVYVSWSSATHGYFQLFAR
jgi:hypothetical protein